MSKDYVQKLYKTWAPELIEKFGHFVNEGGNSKARTLADAVEIIKGLIPVAGNIDWQSGETHDEFFVSNPDVTIGITLLIYKKKKSFRAVILTALETRRDI